MRRLLVAGVVLGWMAVAAVPAAAGGWWSYMQYPSEFVAVGEELVIRDEAFFTTLEDAEAAKLMPFYVYLVRGGYDRALLRHAMTKAQPERWWAADKDAELIRLGQVRFGLPHGNVGWARARVRIPDVKPGRYHLMMCDTGCVRPFGHVVPLPIRVTADPVAARAMRRTETLERRLAQQGESARDRIRNTQEAAERATTRADNVRGALKELTQRVQTLEAEEEPSAAPVPRSSAWPLGGAGVLLAGAALWWVRRTVRPRRAVSQPV